MNAKELRITNWVDNFGQYKQIRDGEDIDDFTEYGHYKSIPITEEWLVNFGCKKSNEVIDEWIFPNKYSCSEKSWSILSYNLSEHEFIVASCSQICYEVKNIKYVHDLQNLYFFLTGEELVLKNEIEQ